VERTPSGRTLAGTWSAIRRRGEEARAANIRTRAKHTGLSEQAAADPRAECLEGRMVLAGAFSATQAEAVEIFKRCRERYLKTIAGPCLASAGIAKRRGRSCDVESVDEIERTRRNYATARAALERAGHRAVAVISDIVERDALPAAAEWPAARRGADALARHYNLHLRTYLDDWPSLTRRSRRLTASRRCR
jgi:hypothetical protein